jgi:hypothetical protein
MAENKTQKNSNSVTDFINSIENADRRADAHAIIKLMQQATGSKPAMWGDAIIGFGDYYYMDSKGKRIDWFKIAFAPRASTFALYLSGPKDDTYQTMLDAIGKYKKTGGCIHIKKMSEVDEAALLKLLQTQVAKCV